MLKITMMLGSFDRLLGHSNMAQASDVARIVDESGLYAIAIGERLSQARYLDNAVRGKRGLGDFSYEIFGPSSVVQR